MPRPRLPHVGTARAGQAWAGALVPTSQNRRPGSDSTNRRNHYRVMQVQPDAPFEVIRANYRALVQKLKLHPDLGGDHWTAAHINAAYHVLSNPVLRAAYDRELLATYDLATLAEGPVRPGSRPQRSKPKSSTHDRRNFYRLLQVQPDAPIELIEASYRALGRSRRRKGWHLGGRARDVQRSNSSRSLRS